MLEIDFDITKNFKFLYDNQNTHIIILEGSSRCFSADTLVMTNNRLKPIKDINVGDMVLSYNEVNKKKEFKKVKGLHQFKNKKKCLKIKLKNGDEIKCTEDHKFYYEGAWISTKHLQSLHYERNRSFPQDFTKNNK